MSAPTNQDTELLDAVENLAVLSERQLLERMIRSAERAEARLAALEEALLLTSATS